MNWLQKVSGLITVTVDPSITQIPIESRGSKLVYGGLSEVRSIADQVIRKYYKSIDPQGDRFMGGRYIFHVSELRENYNGVTMVVRFLPKTKKPGSEKPLTPDHYMYDWLMEYGGGKTGKTIYKSPQDAIDSIPVDSSLAYRGMCWEEWQSIRRSGFIISSGHYNLGDEQTGLTCFSPDPASAVNYAHGFAPIQYQISQTKPGIVIAIPQEGLLSHKDYPAGVPRGELAARGSVPSSRIQHVWMMIATESDDKGFMEFIIPWVPAWDSDAYRDPNMGVFRLGIDKVQTGSGRTSVISGYAIRQMR